ncbi:MAG: polysaccharide biosynthesis tyrosine autokinase [Deltaproteobacteria bacterium]|jgi:polysaccharide chain length determinant protein (PEP-CTERM system associated)|nr:polysaccharide biosynthesis tyrosine autokinase [Deltaproteobacteria bacterium]
MSEFEAEAPAGFQLEDAIEILDRRKWWIVPGVVVGLLIGTALTFLLPPKYASFTTILVEPQEVPENLVRSVVQQDVLQQIELLRHRVTGFANVSNLIEEIGASKIDPSGLRSREDLVQEIHENLHIRVPRGKEIEFAPVFKISYTSGDPEIAAAVASGIADLFISENVKDREQQASSTAQFLERELDRIRQEVSEQEEQLGVFRRERMGSLPEQLDTNLRALDRLNFELAANLESQEAMNQRMALLRRQAEGETTLGLPSSRALALADARKQLFEAERVYTDEHPNVQHLKAQIERLENQTAEEALAERNEPNLAIAESRPVPIEFRPEIEATQLELAARKRREERIRAEIEVLQAKVDATPIREQELRTLTRDYANLTNTYHTLLAKKYEAAISRNLERAQKGQKFEIARRARVPKKPFSPDPLMLLPGGVGFGVGLVVVFIVIAEIRNPAFRSVGRLTRMVGLPVFASIPAIDNDTIYEVEPDGRVDPKLVVYTAPESTPAEQYRGFLPAFLDAENCKVILVTSATRGDGKSLTCMNLAISLATDLGKRVLVIDSDMRRPTAHKLLRVSRKLGLSSVLEGEAKLEECVIDSAIPNLSVLPAGPIARNPLTLIAGDQFLKLIDYARASYDVVMIDSPPLLPVVDTRILRKMADMLVFVVRAGNTPPKAAVLSLKNVVDVSGVVFNSVSSGSFRRYYYYDAYSRYAYGEAPDAAEETDGEAQRG